MSVPTDKIVFTSAMLTLGSTTAASLLPEQYGGQGSLPSARMLIGTSLSFIGLSMLGDFAPKIAGPLSASVAVTALTYWGIPILDNWMNNKHNPVGPAISKGNRKATPKQATRQASQATGLPVISPNVTVIQRSTP